MLDFRIYTFLTLCREKSYTKTAQRLKMTQPAVTQHIQYLEQYYGARLIRYQSRKFSLTEAGETLYRYASVMQADAQRLRELVAQTKQYQTIRCGATLTIGEFVMPPIIRQLTRKQNIHVSMRVGNTQELLAQLERGEIDFALVEGIFDRSKVSFHIFSEEEFICVGGKDSVYDAELETLRGYPLILREKGSGTRDILEQSLKMHSFSTSCFASVMEIGNINVIKQMVIDGAGITFLYKAAVTRELMEGTLREIKIKDFSVTHPFCFVYPLNSLYEEQYRQWAQLFWQIKNKENT